VLEQVSVVMQPSSDSPLKEDFIIPIPDLRSSSSPGIVYVSFTRLEPEEYSLASFACTLKFISKEVDPSSGEPEEEGYDDEYQLEEVELGAGGDYIVPSYATFASEWEQLRGKATATETFALGAMDSIKGETHFDGLA
jgi:coatomer protein complex subunit gamma